MSTSAKPIPDGHHSITPYLIIRGAAQAIEFYQQALGATEVMRMPGPDGKIMHAEIRIGDSPIMMADEFPEWGAHAPPSLNGTSVGLMLYVADADALFNQALAAGGTVMRPMQDQFYGDRAGTFIDPFGHKWTIGTHKEDVSLEEIGRRMAEFCKKTQPDAAK